VFGCGLLRGVFGHEEEETGGERNCIIRSFMMFAVQNVILGERIKGNEMVGACSMRGVEEKCVHNFCRRILKKKRLGRPRRRRK
jgi:hypothetical protein